MSHNDFSDSPINMERFERDKAAGLARPNNDSFAPPSDFAEAERLRTTDTAAMVRDVERKISSMRAELSQSNGFDERSGKPILTLPEGHPRRRALELQLRQMETETLPYTKHRAAEIAQRQAALPTTADNLRAQLERQQRIEAAARVKLEEREVEAMTMRMARRPGGAR